MFIRRVKPSPMLAVAVGALVVGLAAPAAAQQAAHLINGKSIKNHTVAGKKLKTHTLTGKQIKPLVWHPITTLENGWENFGANERPAAYAVDVQGITHLRGTIKGGASGSTAFTLPSRAVPHGVDLNLTCISDDGGRAADLVISGGNVTPRNAPGSTTAVTGLTSLEGITFAS
jgi:hypothetical protein